MTTTTRALLTELVDLDPCGAPEAVPLARPRRRRILPGLAPRSVLASVQHVEPPRTVEPLVWGVVDGRTIVFRVDPTSGSELLAALEAGEEPSAIVEPCQIVAIDTGP